MDIDEPKKRIKREWANTIFELNEWIKNLENDNEIEKLNNYLYALNAKGKNEPTTDIVKIVLSLPFISETEAENILSYLASHKYGWSGNKYYFDNQCFNYSHQERLCKRTDTIPEIVQVETICKAINEIFFNKNCGKIILLIFCYCIASLFCTRLNQEGFTTPFYLQIACDRDSVVYRMLHEIVEICNVNSGLPQDCPYNDEYTCRRYVPTVYYPVQSVKKNIKYLVYNNKDSPIIVSGHESEAYYNNLLREVVNISIQRKPLGIRERFNVLPIFVCPELKSNFDNVLDIDLTNIDIEYQYINILRDNKQRLASWVLEMVINYEQYFFKDALSIDRKQVFTEGIMGHISQIDKKYPGLTVENVKNIGYLMLFFEALLNVFCGLITCESSKTVAGHISRILNNAQESFVELYEFYKSASEGADIGNKKAMRLAMDIEKQYKALKVYIRVKLISQKPDRYIFDVQTLQTTKNDDIYKNADTVQKRLKKYECFQVDLSDATSIKLIVSEKALTDNSLEKILNSREFADSKMKIPYAIGTKLDGTFCIEDMVEFPHLLIAGTTSSGKSTAIMSLLMCIAYRHKNGNVNVIIMDFLGKEPSDFAIFDEQPFLSCPVITEMLSGIKVICRLKEEMERRLKHKDLSHMPYIICIIDEFPSLFNSEIYKENSSPFDKCISMLLSKGRHARIHLVLAAQDIKKKFLAHGINNIPAKIALKCAHYWHSINITGSSGAEKLVGKGQMILNTTTENGRRIQGAYMPKSEMLQLLSTIKQSFHQENQNPFQLNIGELMLPSEKTDETTNRIIERKQYAPKDKSNLPDVIMWTLPQDKVANRTIQLNFQIGNNKANELLQQMSELGLITRLSGNRGWKVIPEHLEDIPEEASKLLMAHGKTKEEIQKELDKKSGVDKLSKE